MALHRSNLGIPAENVLCDQDGFIPTWDDGPWDLCWAHEEATHDEDGVLTQYGWAWLEFGWPEHQARAIEMTEGALDRLAEWRRRVACRRLR